MNPPAKHISPVSIEAGISKEMFDLTYARTFLVTALHGHLPKCPACGHPISNRQYDTFARLKTVQCKQCGRKFNAFSGTIFAGAKIDARQIMGLLLFFHFGFSSARVAKYIGISHPAAWAWKIKLDAARLYMEKLGERADENY